ncbi:MAG: hypothetical protein PHN49_10685 [Candidatus Omnitrophica bacterium]|nr:hypothetical protein [Candidatus Omnitrophota bacterium]MDD5672094.1 hypothetical protein [Candidatus Omnitrophota bacterium]
MSGAMMKNMQGLVLIAQERLSIGVKRVLLELGCRTEEDCERGRNADFVILDSCYVQTQVVEYLKQREQNPFVILIATEREIACNQYDMMEQLDDIIVMPEEDSDEVVDAHWNWFVVPIFHHLYQGLSRKGSSECEMGIGIPLAVVG